MTARAFLKKPMFDSKPEEVLVREETQEAGRRKSSATIVPWWERPHIGGIARGARQWTSALEQPRLWLGQEAKVITLQVHCHQPIDNIRAELC